ncbi:unnamed protein product [Tenebrio molitor]|nr:unnamed protein product [Tenebrio molitor]
MVTVDESWLLIVMPGMPGIVSLDLNVLFTANNHRHRITWL